MPPGRLDGGVIAPPAVSGGLLRYFVTDFVTKA
jgi:hypothetical protein